MSPIRRTGDTPVADGGHEGVLRSPTTHPLAKKQLLQVVCGHRNMFLTAGAKTYFDGWALMQQGRQECRPSDGPATLLRNSFCKSFVGLESCFLGIIHIGYTEEL